MLAPVNAVTHNRVNVASQKSETGGDSVKMIHGKEGTAMHIYKVTDPEFKEYGKIITGYEKEAQAITKALTANTPCPEEGTEYVPEDAVLQNLPEAKEIAPSLFGGIAVEFGWCNGHNTTLNALEYHRNSEFNLGADDFILLLAKQSEIDDRFKLDTAKVKAFLVPAGTLVEVYATTLHYAPCQTSPDHGFRVMVALPKGTNDGVTVTKGKSPEDKYLTAKNKWLLPHPDSPEAKGGAVAGLTGTNIDIAEEIM